MIANTIRLSHLKNPSVDRINHDHATQVSLGSNPSGGSWLYPVEAEQGVDFVEEFGIDDPISLEQPHGKARVGVTCCNGLSLQLLDNVVTADCLGTGIGAPLAA